MKELCMKAAVAIDHWLQGRAPSAVTSRGMGVVRRVLRKLAAGETTIKVDGGFSIRVHSLENESIGRELFQKRSWEKFETNALCSLIRKGDVVMDVGANIGVYSLWLSRATGPTGKVYAFEPDPTNLRLLKTNLRLNRCENVIVLPFALGDSNCHRRMYVCSWNKGYQAFQDLAHTNQWIDVEVKRGEDVLANEKPVLAKIDVEGTEPMVLRGLGHRPRTLMFEFSTLQLRALGNDPLEFLRSLVSDGYSLQWIRKPDLDRSDSSDEPVLCPVSAEYITSIADQTGQDYNILATRS